MGGKGRSRPRGAGRGREPRVGARLELPSLPCWEPGRRRQGAGGDGHADGDGDGDEGEDGDGVKDGDGTCPGLCKV